MDLLPMPSTHRPAESAGPDQRRGFTVTELLVVIGVITLLIALTFPAFSRVRAAARTAKCLSNQRQITMANYSYANSNKGKWVSPRTDDGGITYPGNVSNNSKHCWVSAQGSNITGAYEKPSALEQGKLFPYVGNIQAYVSPDEPTNPLASITSNATTRIRSYSFNACLGVSRPDELTDYDYSFTHPAYGSNPAVVLPMSKLATTSVGQILQPSRMMSTLVEDDTVAYNNEGWIIMAHQPQWVDWPASWRPDAITLSYVDGSVQSYALKNAKLPNLWDTNGHNYLQPPDIPDASSPPDPNSTPTAWDWKFFRDRLNPGVVPYGGYEFAN